MPYIKSERQKALWSESRIDYNNEMECSGELNFMLTDLIQRYVLHKGLSYQTLNDVSGALTECLAEFRRRVIAPYEDLKIKENGDVYLIKVNDKQLKIIGFKPKKKSRKK